VATIFLNGVGRLDVSAITQTPASARPVVRFRTTPAMLARSIPIAGTLCALAIGPARRQSIAVNSAAQKVR
jgi:hypothetical protein